MTKEKELLLSKDCDVFIVDLKTYCDFNSLSSKNEIRPLKDNKSFINICLFLGEEKEIDVTRLFIDLWSLTDDYSFSISQKKCIDDHFGFPMKELKEVGSHRTLFIDRVKSVLSKNFTIRIDDTNFKLLAEPEVLKIVIDLSNQTKHEIAGILLTHKYFNDLLFGF